MFNHIAAFTYGYYFRNIKKQFGLVCLYYTLTFYSYALEWRGLILIKTQYIFYLPREIIAYSTLPYTTRANIARLAIITVFKNANTTIWYLLWWSNRRKTHGAPRKVSIWMLLRIIKTNNHKRALVWLVCPQ